MKHKECTECKTFLPVDEQHFYRDLQKHDGVSCKCKVCLRKLARLRRGCTNSTTPRPGKDRKRGFGKKYKHEA